MSVTTDQKTIFISRNDIIATKPQRIPTPQLCADIFHLVLMIVIAAKAKTANVKNNTYRYIPSIRYIRYSPTIAELSDMR